MSSLGCAAANRAQYHQIATSDDGRKRRSGVSLILHWVDEWHACDAFEVRPIGYGYRGRPG